MGITLKAGEEEIQVGIDLVEVGRVQRLIEKWGERFKRRVFTDGEIAFSETLKNKYQSYASRFCAKEALLKAIGTGLSHGVRWKDMEVVDDGRRKPSFSLEGRVAELVGERRVTLSLSHTSEYATAIVILS